MLAHLCVLVSYSFFHLDPCAATSALVLMLSLVVCVRSYLMPLYDCIFWTPSVVGPPACLDNANSFHLDSFFDCCRAWRTNVRGWRCRWDVWWGEERSHVVSLHQLVSRVELRVVRMRSIERQWWWFRSNLHLPL
ncbi:hypothetical protein DFP72DRAFT_369077 [Ephemerocybe angulata]|uniref:Secreted protein n=1 Tax=Ephemerocybe angulata TaxID=980116 RepID=A0A8H6HW79_9AGAR|nr:hypothetical protein DFP72DRAFT_369077 [Tulosesus angulatus]